MAHTKDKHYWAQLRAALTAGSWDIAFPAKVPKGTPLSWSELLRKFNKHCPGYQDVAELASQTQALALLLHSQDEDHSPEGALALGDECTLPPERVEEAGAGYAALQSLRTTDKDPVQLALAYYAFALGRPSECLSLLSNIKELTDISTRIASYNGMQYASDGLKAPGTDLSRITSGSGSILSSWIAGPSGDVSDGRMWGMVECLRSIALQGMSHERLSPSDTDKALSAYTVAIPLINAVVGELQSSLDAGTVQSTTTYARYRELWRWAERVLRRAIILSARVCDLSKPEDHDQSIWTLFSLYRACSVHWPSTFRPQLRTTICILHSRAFILRTRSVPSDVLKAKAPRWISTARNVLQEFRTLLSVSTRFPRAGERNERVEDFVDLCVAVWEADGSVGEHASWVIDLLWWATRLTFNSFRVYRHMSRLFCASGDPELAKRTLRLYIQVVSKARQAATSDGGSSETTSPNAHAQFDTHSQWVQTLVFGARMLCRSAVEEVDYGKSVELAKEAGTIIQKARTRLDEEDKELVASVYLAEGIWHSVMAYTEKNPKTRTNRLSQSLEALTTAVGTFACASTHYHLALALCRPGPNKDMQSAIENARSAVELDSNESRHWHLLALLLAATGDWKAAKSVLEIGISLAENDLSDGTGQGDASVSSESDGLNIRDFAESGGGSPADVPAAANGHADSAVNGIHIAETVLPPDASQIPPSTALLQPLGDRPRPTRQARFEYALQMRMTQLALTEFSEGVENVTEKWVEVFAWFRDKRPTGVDDRRKSIDSRRVSQDTRPSDVTSIRTQLPRTSMDTPRVEQAMSDQGLDELAAMPIPITITPATPGLQTEESLSSQALQNPFDASGEKRSPSLDEKDRDVSRGKKVREVLKSGVHKGQARITTISKKIGHGVGRHGSLNLKRTNSAPDFHSVLSHAPYQASSIHLRQHHSIHASQQDLGLLEVPPPPRASSPDPASRHQQTNSRTSKDSRLLSDLWLMSAAIFRRQGKIEQVRGAIQEAEVRDEDNPNVWVQLGLYYAAMNDNYRAAESFRKALFIRPNDVGATVYLCRIYLTPESSSRDERVTKLADDQNVDLAAGLLSDLTRGAGWDVPEAWYYLAKAYKLQGRRDWERECLNFALTLSEMRGVRDITIAVGWCL